MTVARPGKYLPLPVRQYMGWVSPVLAENHHIHPGARKTKIEQKQVDVAQTENFFSFFHLSILLRLSNIFLDCTTKRKEKFSVFLR
jgi:hypothetical protein